MTLSLQKIQNRECFKCGEEKKNTKSVRAHSDEETETGHSIQRITCKECYIKSFQGEAAFEPLSKKDAEIQWNLITTDGGFQ